MNHELYFSTEYICITIKGDQIRVINGHYNPLFYNFYSAGSDSQLANNDSADVTLDYGK